MKIELSREQLIILIEALNSHVYWQLSEPEFRRDGFVDHPGSKDADDARAIGAALRLSEHLQDICDNTYTEPEKP